MLAMHYAIPLNDAAAVAAVRARAAERGPLFDGMAGLHQKLFLVDADDPCYATFYLWHEADAARGFLEGAFFAALSQTFGRPEVKLLLTAATDLPYPTGAELALGRHAGGVANSATVSALDPRGGEIFTLSPAGSPGRSFEVMYRAISKMGPPAHS